MLLELKVSQFAIIDHLHVEFQSGLNILSGETGSGKSVLLKSLALLMGEKASADIVRTGSPFALVEGRFDLHKRPDIKSALSDAGFDVSENTLIVKRVIASNDKSKIYLNGSLSTLNQLREMVSPMIEVAGHSAPLIEMTGQHDNRHLLSKAYHIDLLDQYSGHFEQRRNYEEKFHRWQQLRNQIEDFEKTAQVKSQKLDFLKFQANELKLIQIDPVADSSLEEEIKKMKSAHKVLSFVESCENILFSDENSVTGQIKLVQKRANDLSHLESVRNCMDRLGQAAQILDESFFQLRKDLNSFQVDSEALEEKEARLSQIRKVQKKYGNNLSDVLSAFEKMKIEITELENADHYLEQMKKQLAALELELKKIAESLHKTRMQFSEKLTEAVNKELLDLNMKGVTFFIQVEKSTQLSSTGISDIEYLCQSSPKDPKRPIAKVASGGELSRLLLSLKKTVGQSDLPRTYLFDEVDTGVSGNTAEKVGRKLKTIAQGQQVICVTHLPQVAAYGDVHFSIQKTTAADDSAQMEVIELKIKSRIEEIARLISGEKITKTSLAHAEQLLNLSSL